MAARKRCRVPWVTGCCLLLRRECWRDLGGFDPEFFLYYEDVDFCRRARARGWSVWFEPQLQAIHHRPLHSRPVVPAIRLSTRHGLLTYSAKHWPAWQARLLAWLVRVEAGVREWWERGLGECRTGSLFARLATMAGDFLQGRRDRARRRLRAAIREL
jgi:GT2 family glycosyltransferase